MDGEFYHRETIMKAFKKIILCCMILVFLTLTGCTFTSEAEEEPGDIEFQTFLSEYTELRELIGNQASVDSVRDYVSSCDLINPEAKSNELLYENRDVISKLGYQLKPSQNILFDFHDEKLELITIITEEYYFAQLGSFFEEMGEPKLISTREFIRGNGFRKTHIYDLFFVISDGVIIKSTQMVRNQMPIAISPSDSVDVIYLFDPENYDNIFLEILFEQKLGTSHFPDINSKNLDEYIYRWDGFGNVEELYPNIIKYYFLK